jgi:hypothetical protein
MSNAKALRVYWNLEFSKGIWLITTQFSRNCMGYKMNRIARVTTRLFIAKLPKRLLQFQYKR